MMSWITSLTAARDLTKAPTGGITILSDTSESARMRKITSEGNIIADRAHAHEAIFRKVLISDPQNRREHSRGGSIESTWNFFASIDKSLERTGANSTSSTALDEVMGVVKNIENIFSAFFRFVVFFFLLQQLTGEIFWLMIFDLRSVERRHLISLNDAVHTGNIFWLPDAQLSTAMTNQSYSCCQWIHLELVDNNLHFMLVNFKFCPLPRLLSQSSHQPSSSNGYLDNEKQ